MCFCKSRENKDYLLKCLLLMLCERSVSQARFCLCAAAICDQEIKVYLPKEKLTFLAELYSRSRTDKAWLALQHPLLFCVGRKKKPPVPLSIIAIVLLWSLFLPVNFRIGHCAFQRPEARTLHWQKCDQGSVNSLKATTIVLEGGAGAFWQPTSGLESVMQLPLVSRSWAEGWSLEMFVHWARLTEMSQYNWSQSNTGSVRGSEVPYLKLLFFSFYYFNILINQTESESPSGFVVFLDGGLFVCFLFSFGNIFSREKILEKRKGNECSSATHFPPFPS